MVKQLFSDVILLICVELSMEMFGKYTEKITGKSAKYFQSD